MGGPYWPELGASLTGLTKTCVLTFGVCCFVVFWTLNEGIELFVNIQLLLDFYPIDPFKGLPIWAPYWPKLGGSLLTQA